MREISFYKEASQGIVRNGDAIKRARRRPHGPSTRSRRALQLPTRLKTASIFLCVILALFSTKLLVHANDECSMASSSSSSLDDVSSNSCTTTTTTNTAIGQLRPQDLPPPRIFDSFDTHETFTVADGKESYTVLYGKVPQINHISTNNNSNNNTTANRLTAADAGVSMVRGIMEREKVQALLNILQGITSQLDEDPDTVDAMPTYEIFVDSPELYETQTTKILDVNPQSVAERKVIRQRLQSILQPILQQRITPLVRKLYPDVCDHNRTTGRTCTPCYSLIRHYRHGERQSHATHHDGHAIATVVVSLSDFGEEYEGGLYVSTGYGQKEYLPLKRGDAAMHRSFLLHGVKVLDLPPPRTEQTERWSWILWYRDSETCDDHSHTWFASCAAAGDAVCQQLHATKIGNIPGLTSAQVARQVLEWNQKAANAGAGMAAVKIARAYLKLLPSDLVYDIQAAKSFYQLAIQSHDPDGHYGMATLLLTELGDQQGQDKKNHEQQILQQVVYHLESAARLGHAFAMFNLGMVHTYGYGVGKIDTDLAASWFVASGLPEGYFVAYFQAASVGDQERMALYQSRAQRLGMDQVWRKEARRHTGSGGAAGVDLNLPWPRSSDGRQPPVV